MSVADLIEQCRATNRLDRGDGRLACQQRAMTTGERFGGKYLLMHEEKACVLLKWFSLCIIRANLISKLIKS